MLIFGEVGLSGEVRAVSQADKRAAEAARMGFTSCVLPKVCLDKMKPIKGLKMIGVSNVREAIGLCRGEIIWITFERNSDSDFFFIRC